MSTSDLDHQPAREPRIFDSLDLLTHQRSAHTDPSLRDGDSGHGNPYETDPNPESSDADVGDATAAEQAVGGTAEDRAAYNLNGDGPAIEAAAAAEPDEPGLSADEVGGLIEADDRSDDNHRAAEPAAGPTPPAGAGAGAEEAGDLPIAGYADLTVAQVVERLDGLSADDLRAVRAHEAATRGRKTLLTQIDRRLGGAGRKRSAAAS